MLVEFKDGRNVAASIAVIWCGPHGDELIVKHPLVALGDELVRAANELDFVGLVEHAADIASEEISCSARRHSPAFHLLRV